MLLGMSPALVFGKEMGFPKDNLTDPFFSPTENWTSYPFIPQTKVGYRVVSGVLLNPLEALAS